MSPCAQRPREVVRALRNTFPNVRIVFSVRRVIGAPEAIAAGMVTPAKALTFPSTDDQHILDLWPANTHFASTQSALRTSERRRTSTHDRCKGDAPRRLRGASDQRGRCLDGNRPTLRALQQVPTGTTKLTLLDTAFCRGTRPPCHVRGLARVIQRTQHDQEERQCVEAPLAVGCSSQWRAGPYPRKSWRDGAAAMVCALAVSPVLAKREATIHRQFDCMHEHDLWRRSAVVTRGPLLARWAWSGYGPAAPAALDGSCSMCASVVRSANRSLRGSGERHLDSAPLGSRHLGLGTHGIRG